VIGAATSWSYNLIFGPKVVAGDHRALMGVPESALRVLDVRSGKDSGSVVLHSAVGNTKT
jgi:hypothetical protein